jgi:outer membrane biosynthesis protein TonB
MAMKRIAILLLLGPFAAACASAQARTPADRPALEMPPVPARVIDASPPEPALPEPVADLPAAPAPAPPPRAKTPPPPRETAKPEPKPTEPAPAEQAAAVPPAPPLPQLRTPGTPEGPEAARRVSTVIDRARKTLKSIDYQRLPAASQAEYNSANLTITQSEEALKTGKVDIALNLAEKAEKIAKELQSR